MATLQDYLGITKLRDAWPKWKANIIAVNNQVIGHVAGIADKHAAQDVTYSGNEDGVTVKAAIDNVHTRVDTIVAGAGASNTEILDARGTYAILKDRLDGSDSQLAFNTTNLNDRAINVKIPFGTSLTPAKGDGITDDTQSIQNIIDYAETLGLSVFIPKQLNDYLCNGSLQFRRYTHIISNGATLIYSGIGTFLLAEGTQLAYIYPRLTGVIIRKKDNDKIGVGMSVQHSKMGGRFTDCQFYGFEYGVIHSGGTPIDIADQSDNDWAWLNSFTACRFSDNKYGLLCNPNSNGVTIKECLFNGNEYYAIKVFDSFNIRIINSELETNGMLSGGHAIIMERGRSIVIDSNYFEGNGFSDNLSSVIYDGTSLGGYSYHPKIINNYFSNKSANINIKLKEVLGCVIQGNMFYPSTTNIDIDVSEMTSPGYIFINENLSSRNDGSILNLPVYSYISFVKHGLYEQAKQSLTLEGGQAFINLTDTGTSKTNKIETWDDRTRIFNNLNQEIVKFDGQTKQCSLAIQSGGTASRPTLELKNGLMYFDTTLIIPIWYYSGVWKNSVGATV